MNSYTAFCMIALVSGSNGIISLIMGVLYFFKVLILELPLEHNIADSIALLLTGTCYMGLFIYCIIQIFKKKIWATTSFSSVEMRPLLNN